MEDKNIFFIDLSTSFLCLGLKRGDRVSILGLDAKRQSSEVIWSNIKRLFASLDAKIEEINFLGVGLGPGSFTGLRISFSIIKALALSRNLKIVGIPTFDILSFPLKEHRKVCVSFYARKNLFYLACYRDEGGVFKKIYRESLVSRQQLFSFLIKKGFVLCGDAVNFIESPERKKIKVVDEVFWKINPHIFLKLCLGKIARKRYLKISNLKPLYIHSPLCQVKI